MTVKSRGISQTNKSETYHTTKRHAPSIGALTAVLLPIESQSFSNILFTAAAAIPCQQVFYSKFLQIPTATQMLATLDASRPALDVGASVATNVVGGDVEEVTVAALLSGLRVLVGSIAKLIADL